MDTLIDIWVDCDPGIDDAVMLAMVAASADRLRLAGVSCVAGNVPLAVVAENMRRLAGFLGLSDVPLAVGAAAPLVRPAQDAASVHGATGLGGVELPASDRVPADVPAVIALREAIRSLPGGRRMTLVPTGPLTNIALFLLACPDMVSRVERIVLMGGSTVGGNVTSCAEFNIWGDPEAARIVFSSGLPIVMCGLDVTLKCGLTREQVASLAAGDCPRASAIGRMLSGYNQAGSEWAHGVCAIHDAVTILYLVHPELFSGEQVAIEVDCTEERRGETRLAEGAADKNVLLLNGVDMAGFQETLLGNLGALDRSRGRA